MFHVFMFKINKCVLKKEPAIEIVYSTLTFEAKYQSFKERCNVSTFSIVPTYIGFLVGTNLIV